MDHSDILRKLVEQRKSKEVNTAREEFLAFAYKCMQTTYVGALSRFEGAFGEFWGHSGGELTEDQKEIARIWQEARRAILDLGNEQYRKLERALNEYEIKAKNSVPVELK